jgi:phosphonate transport system substrate-binding protein
MALLNGTFDAAATWWNSETRSNPNRMEEKGMIKPGQWRVIWKSPRLPSSPWAVRSDLPQDMRDDIRNTLFTMKKNSPEAWKALTDGKASDFRLVSHSDYEAIVRMINSNLKKRKDS